MTIRRLTVLALLALALVTLAGIVGAHGAKISYTIDLAINLVAEFDSGEPMANAQVTVYGPADPAAPWLTGETDDAGRFTFVPDPAQVGTWDVQVRTAGHGDIVHIPLGEGAALSGGTGYTTPQIVLMAASVIWGFVGTALFFSRGRAASPAVEKDA